MVHPFLYQLPAASLRVFHTTMKLATCLSFLFQPLFQISVKASESSLLLRSQNNCTCPGDILTFECTIVEEPYGLTVWQGSALNKCLSQEIILVHGHSRFTGAHGSCNNGSIVVESLGVENGSFISQLNVTVTSDLIGKSIECAYDNFIDATTVGSLNITESVGISPPKVIVATLIDFSLLEIIFKWSPVVTDCLSLHYNILASNCGSCPTTTTNTTVTCTDVPTDGSMCTFAVQTVVCGDIVGDLSDIINVSLKESDPKLAECTVALTSTSLLAGISFVYATVLTIIVIVIQRKRQATKRSEQELPDVLYEDVGPRPPSSTVRDMKTRKNIAYGQVMPPNSINNS